MRIALLCALFSCFLVQYVAGDICLPTWQEFSNQFSTGAIQQHLDNLEDCIVYCQYNLNCVAVDYDKDTSPPCWIHTNPQDLTESNVYGGDSSHSQYVINRTCEDLTVTDCQLNWNLLEQTHSTNGVPYNYWTEYDCFTFCRYTTDCVAADFDISVSPPCWIHTSYDDLTPANTYQDSATADQYQMNRTCPPPATATGPIDLGQCVGLPMRNGSWCPSDYEIHIISAFYKIHPLCCNGPINIIDAPDSNSLLQFDVFSLDDINYQSKIESCEGKNSCSVLSKYYASDDINNEFCSSQVHRTNFVSLSYSCQAIGHTDQSTSRSLTSFHFPSQSTTATAGNGTKGASISNQSNNRDALILGGIGVALGGLAVLIIIIVAVLWFLMKRQKKNETNHVAMNPMYNNTSYAASTVSDDAQRYGAPVKGVSTTVVYPDEDAVSN